jgi:serine phosphatase RsbU (regulator of sigma subunit)
MPKVSFIVFFLLYSLSATSKGSIDTYTKTQDSLLTLVKADKPDTNKVNHLNQLGTLLDKQRKFDTALYYTNQALQLAQQLEFKKGIANSYIYIIHIYYVQGKYDEVLKNCLTAQKTIQEIGDKIKLSEIYSYRGEAYLGQANYSKALENYLIAIRIADEVNDKKRSARLNINIAYLYQAQDNFPETLKYILISLKLREEIRDSIGIANCYNNLGTIYYMQKNYVEALNSYTSSLKIEEKLKNKKGLAICSNNIGLIYQTQGNYSLALKNYFTSLDLAWGESNDIETEASQNIGNIYLLQKKYAEALNYLSKSLTISEKIGSKYYAATSYISLGELQTKLKDLKLAKIYLNKALLYGNEMGSKFHLVNCYRVLVEIDSIQGNWKAAYQHHKLYMVYRDSIEDADNEKNVLEMTLNHRFEKKEIEIKAENKKQQAIAEEKNRRQKAISWSIGIGLALVIGFAGYILRSLRITNKQKNIIEQQRNEVTKQKDIAEELRHISEKQKHIVEEKQKEIVDSITYAKRIQNALLTSEEYIKNHFEAEHFILFKPKDIVSGDFYWAYSIPPLPGWDMGTNHLKSLSNSKKLKNLFYLITADCTGHGVPGAFMSMLNISYLNENIIERNIFLPNDILNSQRKEIIQALNPTGSREESKDGMDCVLCVYDFNKMLLHFAAANNPLWLVRNNELIEYKADKMPVGKYHDKVTSFALQTIELQKGDVIYTSTDGFSDQFGNNGKKLTKKKFKEELLKIHLQPMENQKEYLNLFFEGWKSGVEQIDDVCLVGVRI